MFVLAKHSMKFVNIRLCCASNCLYKIYLLELQPIRNNSTEKTDPEEPTETSFTKLCSESTAHRGWEATEKSTRKSHFQSLLRAALQS